MKNNFRCKFLRLNLALGIIFLTNNISFGQNIGVNATGAAPAVSAGFDIDFTNKGLLVPRVALTATNAAGPIAAPATSLLVYNTATAGVAPNNVLPGYYYWDGTKWVAFGGSGGKDWSLLGNAGTTAGTNFLGTTDAQALLFKTNNIDRVRILPDVAGTHRMGFGTNFPTVYPAGSTPTLLHIHDGETTANDFALIELTSAKNTATNKVGELNFASTTIAATDRRTASIESYITAVSGVPNVSGDLRFFTNNSATATFTEKMRIEAGGNVGIGTTTPGYRLDLNTGTFAFGNSNVRTESRDNAGLQGNAGAQSGFFETASPTNYPAGASSWWHLIDARHSNNGNNYAMQLSGSFFDQKLYFRKTNNNAAQTWTEVLTNSSTNSNGVIKLYATLAWVGNWGSGNIMTFTVNTPGVTNASGASVSITGPGVPAIDPFLTFRNVTCENNQIVIRVQQTTGGNLTGSIPIALMIFY